MHLILCLLWSSMSSMPFLPKKFKSSNKWFSAHLPPSHVCPLKASWQSCTSFNKTCSFSQKNSQQHYLINQERKITIAMDPLSKHMIHNGFTCRPDLPQPQQVQKSKDKTLGHSFSMNITDD